MGLYTIYIAEFWDTVGRYTGKKKFNRFKRTFKYKEGTYNIKLKEGSWKKKKGLFVDKVYYQYNLNCSDPILMDKKREPVIHPEDYSTIIETKQLKKLNDLDKKSLLGNLDPKQVIIILAIIVGGYLALTGQLTP